MDVFESFYDASRFTPIHTTTGIFSFTYDLTACSFGRVRKKKAEDGDPVEMVSTKFTNADGEQRTVTGMYVRKNIHASLVHTLQSHEQSLRAEMRAQGVRAVDAEMCAVTNMAAAVPAAALQQATEIFKGTNALQFRWNVYVLLLVCCSGLFLKELASLHVCPVEFNEMHKTPSSVPKPKTEPKEWKPNVLQPAADAQNRSHEPKAPASKVDSKTSAKAPKKKGPLFGTLRDENSPPVNAAKKPAAGSRRPSIMHDGSVVDLS